MLFIRIVPMYHSFNYSLFSNLQTVRYASGNNVILLLMFYRLSTFGYAYKYIDRSNVRTWIPYVCLYLARGKEDFVP